MDKIEAMKRFVAVAQTGSFTQAAELLNLPKSAISTSVNNLEAQLQTRLFHRSTRRVTLSGAGARYLPQCQKILSDLEDLETQFQTENTALTGVIRVDMPNRFLSSVVMPHLPDWFAHHPQTQVRLTGTDYRIDPIKEGIDCLIRFGTLSDSSLVARRLGTVEIINCVGEKYQTVYGIPKTLHDLSDHYVVDYSPDLRQISAGFEYSQSGSTHFYPTPSLVSVRTTDAYLPACLNGLGIAQLPNIGLQPFLDTGQLIEVLPQYRCDPMPVSLLYASRNQMPRRVKVFMDWLSHIFKELQSS